MKQNNCKENYLQYITTQPKAEFHNHATTSCKIEYLQDKLPNFPKSSGIVDIDTLVKFCDDYISPIETKADALKILLQGNFENCIKTGITKVGTCIDYKLCNWTFGGSVEKYLEFLSQFKYDNLTILWDISINRNNYESSHRDLILKLIGSGFFSGIDLVSTENYLPNSTFTEYYKVANERGMITKVHAGEQLGADYVRDCILDFSPKHIQHGINIVNDESVMKLAKDRGIIFNVCPSSNVKLGNVADIKSHPISKMVRFGLNVTIATDDLLFFGSDINHEYDLLLQNDVLSFDELEKIRKFSLTL